MIKEAVVKIQLDKDFIVEQIQQFIKQNNYVLITEEEYKQLKDNATLQIASKSNGSGQGTITIDKAEYAELLDIKWMYGDLCH